MNDQNRSLCQKDSSSLSPYFLIIFYDLSNIFLISFLEDQAGIFRVKEIVRKILFTVSIQCLGYVLFMLYVQVTYTQFFLFLVFKLSPIHTLLTDKSFVHCFLLFFFLFVFFFCFNVFVLSQHIHSVYVLWCQRCVKIGIVYCV